jgi:hypothetical protein
MGPLPTLVKTNEFGDPVVVSVSVTTSFFTRKAVTVDASDSFPPELIICFSSPVLRRHKWNARGKLSEIRDSKSLSILWQ